MVSKELGYEDIHIGQKPANGRNGQEASFAELLEAYEPELLQRGQYITGELLKIGTNVILADVSAKRTAVVPRQDIAEIDPQLLERLSVGDEVTLYVLGTPEGDQDLLVSLNKGFEQQDWQRASAYLESEELLELPVTGHNKGGLLVSLGRLRGFVPASHVPQLQHIRDRDSMISRKAELVGETLPLKVIEVDRDRRRLVMSARQAQKEVRRERLQALKDREGEAVPGRVSNLVSFGAFVDLDGLEGLVHVSEIAWQRVEDPGQFLAPGDEVEVQIKHVDVERERVSLSRKALLPSPWEAFARAYQAGDLLEGVVTNVTDFGAFVEVAEHVEGLIHASEMPGTQDFAPQDLLFPGDSVLVRIVAIQPEQERVALSQRRVSQQEQIAWIWQREQAGAAPPAGEEE